MACYIHQYNSRMASYARLEAHIFSSERTLLLDFVFNRNDMKENECGNLITVT